MNRTEFNEILLAARPSMLKYARQLDYKNAEDITQEACIKALRLSETFYPKKLINLLHIIVFQCFCDIRKKEKRRKNYDILIAGDMMIPANQEHRVLVNEVVAELKKLKPQFRDALLALTIRDSSQIKAAAEFGIKHGTLNSRFARGRQKLKEKFQ